MLPFCFCRLGGLTDSGELPPSTLLPAAPELPTLLPMTPTPLPGAKPETGLGAASDDPCSPDGLEPKPRIPEPTADTPDPDPSRPPDEDVGPPTVMLAPPMEPTALLVLVAMTPPREPSRLEPMVPAAAAWA